jgi:hypothetical protein
MDRGIDLSLLYTMVYMYIRCLYIKTVSSYTGQCRTYNVYLGFCWDPLLSILLPISQIP